MQIRYITELVISREPRCTCSRLCERRYMSIVVFFFSSRRRHTRLQGDWSSDVCSSDLTGNVALGNQGNGISVASGFTGTLIDSNLVSGNVRETGGSSGISISGSHTLVTRNRVGTNAAGTAMIANNGPGIAVFFSPKGGHRSVV